MPSVPLPTVPRYLWAEGNVSTVPQSGTLLDGRYQVLQFPLLLDQAGETAPQPLPQVPAAAQPYLSLSIFPVSIPRPFTQVTVPGTQEQLLLLENIPLEFVDGASVPRLRPNLLAAWATTSAFQQIVWLWQLAKLWQPCLTHQVAATLLNWQHIRVDAEDIRLLTLQAGNPAPSLMELGRHWQSLVATAASPIREYLTHLTTHLIGGKGTAAGLVDSLTGALEFLAADREIVTQLATCSDQGPVRSRNEDACYPTSGTANSARIKAALVKQQPAPFTVVCDGIGGHQGGDIASKTAIEEVTQHLQAIATLPNLTHEEVVAALEQSIRAANQAIVARNDEARSQDRDRMGTTIVMAFVYGARLYIGHLGDSRAYRVRNQTCLQITLDDDVAARETRLGLELYQTALQAPGSGALVQALGMADASHLHPTVEMYPLVGTSLFVLCSDGLSDYGLLERVWQTELKPVVTGPATVAAVSQTLVELANTHNGHDNVTVALLRIEANPLATSPPVPVDIANQLVDSGYSDTIITHQPSTAVYGRQKKSIRFWGGILGAIALLVGALAMYLWLRPNRVPNNAPLSSEAEAGSTLSPAASPPTSREQDETPGLSVGDYLQVSSTDPESALVLIVTDTPPVPPPPPAVGLPARELLPGAILQVEGRQKTPNEELWVRLQVCSIAREPVALDTLTIDTEGEATLANDDLPTALPGNQGWLLETSLKNFSRPALDTSTAQKGLCLD